MMAADVTFPLDAGDRLTWLWDTRLIDTILPARELAPGVTVPAIVLGRIAR